MKSSKIQTLSRKKDLQASHSLTHRRAFITNSRPLVLFGQDTKYRREEKERNIVRMGLDY